MPFTDDDLKRLKEGTYDVNGPICSRCHQVHGQTGKLKAIIAALLARLETAEDAIERPHYVPCAEIPCEQCEKILAWRKEAGK